MKDRILSFLQNENKSYAQFAEEIGVQPSGISHILSGRNNPSLDFVMKMLHRYPSLSAEWLLFGRGTMFKYVTQPTLFDTVPPDPENEPETGAEAADLGENTENESPAGINDIDNTVRLIENNEVRQQGNIVPERRKIAKVMFFYSDKTFSEYRPE